jgi:ABC-type uncharacterized transport system ATPase subunit
MSDTPAIELRKINKSFGAVHANKDIDLVEKGQFTGLSAKTAPANRH